MQVNKFKVFVFTMVILVGLLSFQNCSNVALEEATIEKLSINPSLNFKSNFCSQARFSMGASSKFIFIMDLSASNFGNWYSEKLGGQTLYYWDPNLATDQNGARFDAVSYFLDNCGSQSGNRFAFIGFSQSAGILKGGNLSCDDVEFTSKENIKSQMNAIKTRENADRNWYNRWKKPAYLSEPQPDSLMSSVTSYNAASKCMEKLVLSDLLNDSTANADRYTVFFISDGLPQDLNGTGCNTSGLSPKQIEECHLNASLSSLTMTRTAALSKGSAVQLQGIYYGNESDGAVPAVLDALSREGGSSGVTKLSGFQSNQNALCELIVTQNSVDLRPDQYGTINLTTYRKAGEIISDSDMDGLPDHMEASLGYDPQNPRSSGVSGVLDGICERLGGRDICQQRRNQITCDPNKFDGLGLSECDFKILGLHLLPGALPFQEGIDSDQDGMPDFVEIIKGLDPTRRDMTEDPDGDGYTNRDEIIRGTDPFFSDSWLRLDLLNHFDISYRSESPSPQCTHGDWVLSTSELQYSRTLPVQSFPAHLAAFNHPRNAQVLFMMYRLTPLNSAEPLLEYYGQIVRVTVSGFVDEEILSAEPSELTPSDFQLIGKGRP